MYQDQTTALMLAAVTGNVEIVTALLDRDVDVNSVSKVKMLMCLTLVLF